MARTSNNNDDLPKAKINKLSLKKTLKIFNYASAHKWKLYLSLIFLVLTSVTVLLFPKLLGDLVIHLEENQYSKINTTGALLILVLVGQSIFSYFRIYFSVNFTENTLAALRRTVYQHLITLPMTYFGQKRVGDLNSRMSADIGQIRDTLTTTIAEFLRQLIMIIGGITILFYISPQLTLLMLSIVPVVAISAVIFGRFIKKIAAEVQEKIADSNTIIEETLQGISNVKAFANEYFENIRYKKSTEEIVVKAIRGGKYRGAFASFIIFCMFGSIVAVIWYGVHLAAQGQLLIGSLTQFIIYSAFVGVSLGGIADLYAQIQRTVGAAERVFEILDERTEEISISQDNTITNRINGDVTFENVAFYYPSRKEIEVLKNVSIKVNKGETIAIVGPSGSGKSTLGALLLRFYDPVSGRILIDGKDINDYDLSDLRNNMAIVPQDVILFGGSIKENIAYGKPSATDEEIAEAAQKANALEFIDSFPEKFETIVGERGMKLSGGQRQRIAIARAVLKDPSILILDEATSSLDSKSERVVQDALDLLMVGRTSFVIAHRLSTIRKADKIIVIENGEVKENGSHEELMQNDSGLYQNLVKLQSDLVA